MGRCGVTVVFCCAYAVEAMNIRTAVASLFIIQITRHFACRFTPLDCRFWNASRIATAAGGQKQMRRIVLLSAVLIVAAFAANAQTNGTLLTCESMNNVRHTCRADVATGVTLNRQFSKDACVRGSTWGTTRNNDGIWVDAGCRAEFLVGGTAQRRTAALQTATW